jgi:hypothetical protein
MTKDGAKNIYQNFTGTREKSKLELFTDEAKAAVFSVLFVLLKEEEDADDRQSKMFEAVLEYLQVINFMFNEKVRPIWNSSSVFAGIISIITFFNIGDQFGTFMTETVFLIQFYFLVVLILLIMLDIIYVSISFKRKKFNAIWPLTLLRNFVNIAVTVLFQPIVETLLEIVTSPDSVRVRPQRRRVFPRAVPGNGLLPRHPPPPHPLRGLF